MSQLHEPGSAARIPLLCPGHFDGLRTRSHSGIVKCAEQRVSTDGGGGRARRNHHAAQPHHARGATGRLAPRLSVHRVLLLAPGLCAPCRSAVDGPAHPCDGAAVRDLHPRHVFRLQDHVARVDGCSRHRGRSGRLFELRRPQRRERHPWDGRMVGRWRGLARCDRCLRGRHEVGTTLVEGCRLRHRLRRGVRLHGGADQGRERLRRPGLGHHARAMADLCADCLRVGRAVLVPEAPTTPARWRHRSPHWCWSILSPAS